MSVLLLLITHIVSLVGIAYLHVLLLTALDCGISKLGVDDIASWTIARVGILVTCMTVIQLNCITMKMIHTVHESLKTYCKIIKSPKKANE